MVCISNKHAFWANNASVCDRSGIERQKSPLYLIFMLKKLFENKKAVLFDLNNTIINSESLWVEAISRSLDSLGYGWASMPNMTGLSPYDRWTYLLNKEEIKIKRPIKELVDLTNNEFINIFLRDKDKIIIEGFWNFAATIKMDKGLKTAVVTNSSKEVTMQVLKQYSLENSFDLVLTGSDVKKQKPDPEIYNTALKQLNLKPAEVIAIEDSVVGSKASTKAKIDTIVMWNEAIYRSNYPEQIKLYVEDYNYLTENMDIGFDDMAQKAKLLQDRESENQSL